MGYSYATLIVTEINEINILGVRILDIRIFNISRTVYTSGFKLRLSFSNICSVSMSKIIRNLCSIAKIKFYQPTILILMAGPHFINNTFTISQKVHLTATPTY